VVSEIGDAWPAQRYLELAEEYAAIFTVVSKRLIDPPGRPVE
jgi:hypothetical protein